MTTLTAPSMAVKVCDNGPSLDEMWAMVTGQLIGDMNLGDFNAYIRGSRLIECTESVATIAMPSPQARDWCASRLSKIVQNHFKAVVLRKILPDFVYLNDETEREGQESAPVQQIERQNPVPAPLQAPKEPEWAVERVTAAPVVERVVVQPAEPPAQPMLPATGEQPQTPPAEEPEWLALEEVSDSIEAALQERDRLVAFPRYELRHLPLVGPEFFFLRLAFLQQRFLNTQPTGRGQPFVTLVDSLLQWANVGRATLHRFKKGDPARGLQPAADWFGIEQLPSGPRTGTTQQPCRYRLQTGIPLTPMDAERLRELLLAAGLRRSPIQALQELCSRPVQEILQFPPPAPTEAHKQQTPTFTTVASVVQSALSGTRIPAEQRGEFQDWVNRLSDHITMPQQVVIVSWYFLQEWLPFLGHEQAALVLYTRAQGYYNPQDQELRDEIHIPGGYGELANVIGLKRQRTIADWLPNIFDRQSGAEQGESEKWRAEQQRMQQVQKHIAQFIQVIPGSRKKMPAGHYAFNLHVEIKGEPLTPLDQTVSRWVYQTLHACAAEDVLGHFHAWVTSPVIAERASDTAQNDGAGILTLKQNDGWGIQAAQAMTARESGALDDDGWGILEDLLNDGAGILDGLEMTAGELFKRLLKLNTFWKTLPERTSTLAEPPKPGGVVVNWDLNVLCKRNGGINPYRQGIIAGESGPEPFLSWLLYAYSIKGQGIKDPFGWALTRLKDQPGSWAEGVCSELARVSPEELAAMLKRHIESGAPPADPRWRQAFQDEQVTRLRELAAVLGVG